MDQDLLKNVNGVLQAVALAVAIVVGIVTTAVHLRKLGPTWRNQFANWVISLGPPLAIPAGVLVFAIWDKFLIADALILIGFILQTIAFLSDQGPVDRKAVVNFGLACGGFFFLISFVVLGHFIRAIVGLQGREIGLIEKIVGH